MSDPRDEHRVSPVGGRPIGRVLPIATFLIGILIGAAFVKPWDLLFPAGAPTASGPSTSAAARATPSPSPAATPTPDECAFAGAWRVFGVGQRDPLGGDGSSGSGANPTGSPTTDIGNPLRRWIEIVPLTTASGPDDERIPFVTIVSDRIAGLSYCPPPDTEDPPASASRMTAWRVVVDPSDPTTMIARSLSLRAAGLEPSSSIEVPVFIGDIDAVDRANWSPGRYVFEVESSTDPAYQRWFGVEIRTPAGSATE